MFKNQLKVIFRNLKKGSVFSLVNIIGLGISICAFLIIILYVNQEKSFDNFHTNKDRIFRVYYDKISADEQGRSVGLAAGAGPDLVARYPEIEKAVRFWNTKHLVNLLKVDNESYISEKLHYAENGLFELFDFELLSGDVKTALSEPNSVIITETLAEKLFDKTDVLGQFIDFQNGMSEGLMKVTAVLKDLPKNTHFDFEVLVSYETLIESSGGTAANTYNWNAFPTYLLLGKEVNSKTLEDKFPEFVKEHYAGDIAEGKEIIYGLKPLEDIHLYSNARMELGTNGDYQLVNILFIVGVFILGLSYFNYINLVSSLALKRNKEIGVRKVAGATRTHLVSQFLSEAFVFNLLGVIMGFTLFQISKPVFVRITGIYLPELGVWISGLIPVLLLILVLGTIVSGLYPAIIMSRQKLADSLKGQKDSKGKTGLLNKTLIVFQFVILCFLLIGSLVVKKQIDFMLTTDWGFEAEQSLIIKGPAAGNNISSKFGAFQDNLSQLSGVRSVAQSTAIPGKEISWINTSIRVYGAPKTENKSIHFMGISDNFVASLNLDLLAGRNFSRLIKSDTGNLLLNRTAVKIFGFSSPEDAIDQRIRVGGKPMTVVGIVEDYMQGSFKNTINPTAFMYAPWANNYFVLKVNNASKDLIQNMESVFQNSFPASPFEFFFLDEFFQRQFESERTFGRIISLFTILAVWISCLGLIGLTTHAVIQRRKELGIRKVLGATPKILVLLMSKDMLILNVVSFLISVPLTYFATNKWLANYAQSTALSPWLFLLPIVTVVALTLITTISLSLKTSLMNPSIAIKYE